MRKVKYRRDRWICAEDTLQRLHTLSGRMRHHLDQFRAAQIEFCQRASLDVQETRECLLPLQHLSVADCLDAVVQLRAEARRLRRDAGDNLTDGPVC
jgi:hypothetical protein